jgi:hypothetical protein
MDSPYAAGRSSAGLASARAAFNSSDEPHRVINLIQDNVDKHRESPDHAGGIAPRPPRYGCKVGRGLMLSHGPRPADKYVHGWALPENKSGTGNAYVYQARLNCGWPSLKPPE